MNNFLSKVKRKKSTPTNGDGSRSSRRRGFTFKKLNLRFSIASLFDLTGIGAIVWGFHLIAPFLGFIVGGAALIYIALAIDPPAAKPENREQ